MTRRADRRAPTLVLAAAALGVAVGSSPARAQAPWVVTPSLSGQLTYTNNVDLQPHAQREGDFILTITPGVAIEHSAPRTVLRGSVALPIALYASTGDRNNEVRPTANLFGSIEPVKDFFFVEAAADVSQTYFDPFGARPIDIDSATDNRYTSQSYRISPYIRGQIGSDISYTLRDDNLWSRVDDSPIGSRNVYTNRLFGTINRVPAPWGWGADLQRIGYDFPESRDEQVIELARLRGVYRPDAQLQLFVTGGWERNRFTLSETDGAIYGGGFTWRPTERTTFDGMWERRFFGDSYGFSFDHRTPRTIWSLSASRNVTSYPEQLGTLPAGTFVPGILDELLASRIPDPVERARYIIQFVRDQGLPVFLADQLVVYSQQIFLREQARGTLGLLGVRNSVFLSVYRSRSEAITGTGELLPPALSGLINNEQLGASVIWSHQLSASTSLTLTASGSTTESVDLREATTDQWALRLHVTRPLSARTNVFAGARYQSLTSDVTSGYREAAVFVGASHRFR